MPATRYLNPLVLDVTDDADALTRLAAMHRQPSANEYRAQAFTVDILGKVRADVSPFLQQSADATVRYDSTSSNQQGCQFGLSTPLQWGSDLVALYALIRNQQYNAAAGLDPATYVRFPVGHHVITTPGFTDMDNTVNYSVTGYGKNYLLQSALDDAYAYAPELLSAGVTADTYFKAVQDLFRGAGIIAVTDDLGTVCDYPGDFEPKLFTTFTYYTPTGGGGATASPGSYLDCINDVLHTAGYAPLRVQRNGRWLIEPVIDAVARPVQWVWWGSKGLPGADVNARVLFQHASYTGDVFNVPNEWHFLVDGFPESVYGIRFNNNNIPPAGKLFTGRSIKKYQAIQVTTTSGLAEFAAQAQKVVTDDLSAVEKMTFNTAPWPVAGHADVFQVHHAAFPYDSVRKMSATQWTMALFGGPTQWSANAVASVGPGA